MSVTFTPQFSQTQPGLITGYLRSEPMNGLPQQLTERGLPWAASWTEKHIGDKIRARDGVVTATAALTTTRCKERVMADSQPILAQAAPPEVATNQVERKRGWHRAERKFAMTPCEVCGEPGKDRHHKDANPLNNDPSNVLKVCRKCHMELDGRLEQFYAMASAPKPDNSRRRWANRSDTKARVGDPCPKCGRALSTTATRKRGGFRFRYIGCRPCRGGCGYNAGSIKTPICGG
jgi:hypothetical protein